MSRVPHRFLALVAVRLANAKIPAGSAEMAMRIGTNPQGKFRVSCSPDPESNVRCVSHCTSSRLLAFFFFFFFLALLLQGNTAHGDATEEGSDSAA